MFMLACIRHPLASQKLKIKDKDKVTRSNLEPGIQEGLPLIENAARYVGRAQSQTRRTISLAIGVATRRGKTFR